MSLFTLTTDLGIKDYHLASVKGYIYSQLPNAKIVDITHFISPFNIAEAAFILKNCYLDFPSRTIHLLSVESVNDTHLDYILAFYKGQYILAKDNGIISLIVENKPEKIFKLNRINPQDVLFPLKNILAKVACKLAVNHNEYDLGEPVKGYNTITSLNPMIEQDAIRGTIIYIDNFGNAITNIRKADIERYNYQGKINIHFSRRQSINQISEYYSDVPEGEALCLFGTTGFLEIAINKGNASQLLALAQKGNVLIEFM